MYDTCIMKEQIKKKSVEEERSVDDCSRSTIKNKSDFCYDGQLYPQRFSSYARG